MSDRTVTLKLSFPGEPPTTVSAVVHEWSMFDRVKRAALGLALGWCAAGLAVFLPVVHFVLVPALLVGAPAFAMLRFTEARRLKSMKGSCPRCKKDREFQHLELRFNGPRSFTCDECGNLIALAPAGALTSSR
ncbi:MAG: hypothetical protein JNK82_06215 [Myxococcaceae bacterium]|nr:hypothetical protein [Myxococcaceae bacterium]